MRLAYRFGRALVAVAVAGLLGHVCAVPDHLSGAVVATQEGGHTPSHGAQALDGASCDGVPTPSISMTAPDGDCRGPVRALGPARARSSAGEIRVVAASPPLFLLHTALLI